MAVRLVKFTSGEDVVADITEDGECTRLKNPAKFIVTDQGLGMMPWMPFVKTKELTVKTQHVLCVAELEDEIYNAYNSRFGSGIVMPPRGATLKGIMPERE